MSKLVRLTLAKAIAKANLRRAEAGKKPITMNALAVQAGVAATTITRLARTDEKAASALSLDLASTGTDSPWGVVDGEENKLTQCEQKISKFFERTRNTL